MTSNDFNKENYVYVYHVYLVDSALLVMFKSGRL